MTKLAIGGVWLACVVLGLLSTAAAEERPRVALVIGNGAYLNAPKLPNPPNDAHDVAALLRGLQFDVIEATDLDRSGFVNSVGTFLEKAATAPASLIYYAGHGVQFDDDNYLIATDAKLENTFSLKTEAFSLKEIIAELESVSSVNLIFLDACRDNPFAEKLTRSLKTRGVTTPIGRGLARIAPNGANTFIAFAAAPGDVALDGDGGHSPFTQAFLKNVKTSNEDVMLLFKGIIRDVLAATDGKQRPQMVSGMTIDFHFQGTTTVTVNQSLPEAQAAYDAAARINSREAYQLIIDGYPATVQAKLAAAAIAALPKPQEVASLPSAAPPSAPQAAAPAVTAIPANPPEPGVEARQIALAELPADVDPRLRTAVAALGQHEIAFGFFRDHLYIAVLTWGGKWDASEKLAESAGGHLVTIGDKDENDFVYKLFVKDDRFVEVSKEGDKNGPWIGLYQPKGSHEPKSGWRWVTDEPLKYANWTVSQPNNYGGHADVARFYSYGPKEAKEEQRPIRWDDGNGDDGTYGFIMEIEPSSAKAQTDGPKSSALTYSFATAEAYSGADPSHGNDFIGNWVYLHEPRVDDQVVGGLIGFEITGTFPPGRPEAIDYDIGISDPKTIHYFNMKYSMQSNELGNRFFISGDNVNSRWKAVFLSMSKADQRIMAAVCNSVSQPEAENKVLQVSEKVQDFWRVPKNRQGIIAVGKSCYAAVKSVVGHQNETFVEAK